MRCTPLDASLQQHYTHLITFLLDGRVVPFLGAGANLCGRPANVAWPDRNRQFLPSGSELSAYLAKEFNTPADPDLARGVDEYVKAVLRVDLPTKPESKREIPPDARVTPAEWAIAPSARNSAWRRSASAPIGSVGSGSSAR